MDQKGYYRFPHIFQDRIVFVAEDDLWLVSASGGRAERLTAGVSEASHPAFSPDGKWIAFVGSEEGPTEVYVIPACGGVARRLTYHACLCQVLGWSPDGREIVYSSNASQMATTFQVIFAMNHTGGLPRQIPVGMATSLSYGPRGGIVLGRHTGEYSYWKGYRGGRMGQLWCDSTGNGTFERLLRLDGNITNPCWVGERIYFLSDHCGIGNLFSCTPLGEDIRQHTTHHDFYARHLASDGHRLVYSAGADLYQFDPQGNHLTHLDITLPSSRTQRNRKFVDADDYLDTVALHPHGHSLALTTRGKAFAMGNWEGPVLQYGQRDGVRYRFLEWLNDGMRMVAVSDAPGREALVLFDKAGQEKTLMTLEFGRATELLISPTDDVIALTNHRYELMIIDLKTEIMRVLDRSPAWHIGSMSWSPDGRWLAYSFPLSEGQSAIKVCQIESGETSQITDPILHDCAPAFDPEGTFLYFLGERVFNPAHDNLQFDLHFPFGVKPYLILLQKDRPSPFLPVPRAFDAKETDEKDKPADSETPLVIRIDLEGIRERIVPFPVSEKRFQAVHAMKGKALFLSFPVELLLPDPLTAEASDGTLHAYDLKTHTYEELIEKVESVTLSRDHTTLLYHIDGRVRVLKVGDKASDLEEGKKASRETGWISLQRIKVSIQPAAEWRQMFAEAWRLQQEQFWSEVQAAHIDWEGIATRYAPLLERITSREELSDLLWEVQGELGTSHTYEYDGDYRERPYYRQGFLGVDWHYDTESHRYRITRILKGDPSDPHTTSPLAGPGLLVSVGDAVLTVNGQSVTKEESPHALLVNQGGQEVQLTIEDAHTQETRHVSVKALSQERPLRYREWVQTTRQSVHELSGGRVGYIHIPDMGAKGYAEFHRSYLGEFNAEALVIDVRWNGGGNISSLLLSKLARKRIGYKFSRWGSPHPYLVDAPCGPMVALTNEYTGSDGDKFSHGFKVLGLGPLIGKRTWGGTIGILPQHDLVDGTTTTQPEYANWFPDIEFGLENRGTDPDIEVEITPQEYQNDVDPQLLRAIREALSLIEVYPRLEPPMYPESHSSVEVTAVGSKNFVREEI